jgi:nucleotidyltransferase substrate binding protein (TIGR01987 family)
MTIDLSPFVNAVTRLEEGLDRYQQNTEDLQIRDGLIQRFEFTYEIAHKMLKRYLEFQSPTPGEFDEADFHYLIRTGNEKRLLLGDWEKWRGYRELRGKANYACDEEVAVEVVEGIPAFLDEVRFLRDQLTTKAGPG